MYAASRARGRSLSKPDLRYSEGSEYSVMGQPYGGMPARMPDGSLPMAEPSYMMAPVRQAPQVLG